MKDKKKKRWSPALPPCAQKKQEEKSSGRSGGGKKRKEKVMTGQVRAAVTLLTSYLSTLTPRRKSRGPADKTDGRQMEEGSSGSTGSPPVSHSVSRRVSQSGSQLVCSSVSPAVNQPTSQQVKSSAFKPSSRR
ncbi:uncharacterized protein LOC127009330 [Eriocheir sinensis]|uniref:uncharacterized protein LOC127009330 n=1 Tax=Eriocheir sinensis TaxID=95602 RepID=UPI0021C993AD|nr:uncharacterized protein LOC127009330 [Eriocheir sinensis]